MRDDGWENEFCFDHVNSFLISGRSAYLGGVTRKCPRVLAERLLTGTGLFLTRNLNDTWKELGGQHARFATSIRSGYSGIAPFTINAGAACDPRRRQWWLT